MMLLVCVICNVDIRSILAYNTCSTSILKPETNEIRHACVYTHVHVYTYMHILYEKVSATDKRVECNGGVN